MANTPWPEGAIDEHGRVTPEFIAACKDRPPVIVMDDIQREDTPEQREALRKWYAECLESVRPPAVVWTQGTQTALLEPRAESPTLYAYSFDEEEYHGTFSTREEALAEALAEREDENTIVWTGEQSNAYDSMTPKHIGERIAEDLNEWTFDEIPSDDDVIVVTPEQAVELGNLVLAWFRENVKPARYGIKYGSVIEHNIAADGKEA